MDTPLKAKLQNVELRNTQGANLEKKISKRNLEYLKWVTAKDI